MLVPLAIPPGIVKNGTPYNRRGRWQDSNLVRWHNEAVRPVGGWLRRTKPDATPIPPVVADPSVEVIRDLFTWRAVNGISHGVGGSNRALYHVSETGVITDITPAGINVTGKDAIVASGYGIGPYSFGAYGVFTQIDGVPRVPPQRWVFDTYGEILLAAQRGFGPLYEMDPATLAVIPVPNAPNAPQDILVTEQRIVLTVGSDNDPRLIKWSDQEDRTDWTPSLQNQAGSLVVQTSGQLLSALTVLETVLIVGNRDAIVGRYIGPPYVFSFDFAGRNCGALSAESIVSTSTFAVWWGDHQFWMFDGSVQKLQCAVQDFLDKDVNDQQTSKITAVTNQQFSEVWWFYQSANATEVDSYVAWCYADNTWWTGRLARTAGVDAGVIGNPIWVSDRGEIFNHELVNVLVDGAPFIESGIVDVAGGQQNMAVRYIYPDTQSFGDTTMTIFGQQFPTSPEFAYGPYAYNNPTPVRAMGRGLRFRFDGSGLGFEIGTMRLDVSPQGGGVR